MATLKINVMSIVAIIVMVSGIIALGLYEAPYEGTTGNRGDRENTYEAFLIIPILLALVVLVVTCADIEQLKTKTFLIYALAAVLLLIGIIIFAVVLEERRSAIATAEKLSGSDNILVKDMKNKFNHWVASIEVAALNQPIGASNEIDRVFAVVALVAAVAGTAAPFVCNK